jgi:hypothetical protein
VIHELTLPLGTSAIRVNVSFNEANVALDDRSNILDPGLAGKLVILDRA